MDAHLGTALPRSTPADRGVDATGIAAFVDALEAAPQIEPHSLMVARGGHVVAEGWWAPFRPDGLHLLYSLSKTFAATAVALAADEGLLSLDDTVLDHFPELDAEVTDPRVRRLRLRHLAAMASGHTSEALDRADAADPHDLVRGFLRTPPEQEPGSVFAYNQPCTYTLGAVVARRSGQSLTEYLRPRLLDPLGIGEVAWTRDASGRELGYTGLHATTEDVLRLGLLYLQDGVWEGRRLLPAGWVAEASRAHVSNDHTGSGPDWSQGYGYQLWRSQHGYRGDGAYGQFCLVLPEHDTVVAMTAATEDMQGVLDAAWTHLLPALGRASSGSDADARLAQRLTALQIPRVEGDAQPPAATADAWAGRTTHRAADGPLAEVSTERTRDGVRLTLVGSHPADAGTPLTADVGLEGWLVSRCPTPGGPLPVAVSGAWSADGTLHAAVLFVETPHRLDLTLHTDGRAPEVGWRTEPLGNPPLVRLRAPHR